jgi:acyl-CoA thioesterase
MDDATRARLNALLDALTGGTVDLAISLLSTLTEGGNQPGGPFARLLGVRFTALEGGRCTAELDVAPHLLNPLGIAHGGVAFALADYACGGAALSALGEPRFVTQDMQIRYHGPARAGCLVAAAGTVHKGTRTITTECRVTQNGILVASVTGTFAILSPAELAGIQRPTVAAEQGDDDED